MKTAQPPVADRRAAAPVTSNKIPWNPILALVIAAVSYVGAIVLSNIILSIYPMLHHWTTKHADSWLQNSVYAQFFSTLIFEVIIFGAIVLFVNGYKKTLATIGVRRPRWRDIGIGLLGFVVYFVVFAIVIAVARHLIPALNVDQDQDIGFNSVHGSTQLILTFASLVILPPIVEELAFRGLIFTSLRKWLNFYWAALLTGILFALPHLFESGSGGLLYIAGIDTLILSTVNCYMRERTDRLWPGMLLHALKNFVAFYSLYIIGGK